ncbi:D-lactonohydrolase-like protein [Flammula alnicola]|nr:D-lactonohydrolase-like protein [Flammula alnicola]
MKLSPSKVVVLALYHCAIASGQNTEALLPGKLPPQSVFVDPLSFAVLGPNGSFRDSAFTQFFNPTLTAVPFFQIFDPAFLAILGPNPSFHEVASNATFAFAHEAPIYVPETDEVFFASNDGGALGNSDLNHNNQVGKISMKAVEAALQTLKPGDNGTALQVPVTEVSIVPDLSAALRLARLPNSTLVVKNFSFSPPSISLMSACAHNTTVLLDNFFGRQFNSLNDIKIHPTTGGCSLRIYGFLNHFRSPPLMPNQVYRFDPAVGSVRVVATDFDKCNGIAFTPDGKIAYVTDTGANSGFLGNNQTEPATIYAFDVDPTTQVFLNRRVFAYTDTGIPDGVQIDATGNVYAGCGDGVHVWSPSGTLLGKFFIGTTSANMVFAGDERLVIMAETGIFVAKIAAKEGKVAFP